MFTFVLIDCQNLSDGFPDVYFYSDGFSKLIRWIFGCLLSFWWISITHSSIWWIVICLPSFWWISITLSLSLSLCDGFLNVHLSFLTDFQDLPLKIFPNRPSSKITSFNPRRVCIVYSVPNNDSVPITIILHTPSPTRKSLINS